MDHRHTWKTCEAQVDRDSLEKLVQSFFDAEEVRWTESSSPFDRNVQAQCSCCNSSLSRANKQCAELDPGFKILRHGRHINQIHAYFKNLEPQRYRPKLTAGIKLTDRQGNTMRVVKREESQIDQCPAANEDEPSDPINLKEEDWRLYEMVVHCCLAPYLTAPPIPSPYSPASSPTSPKSGHPFEFSYSPPPRAQIHSPFRSKAFSFGSSITSPEYALSASTSTMKELVRNTFGLTKHMHITRERQIREKFSKNSERILVEDLLTQLYQLNNNCHPYYRIQSFLDKNGYDEWVTAEKENINKLIKVFWHFPLPPCPSAFPLNQIHAHEGYVTLLKKFIRYESANKLVHSVYGDVTPTAPLSAGACRILKEFGLRYGVGLLYRKLVYLRYLVDHFECEVWIIQHVTALMEDIMRLVTSTPEIYVKEEFVMLLHVLTLLLRLSKYYLTRITRLFPKNSPPGGLTALVTMAELAQDAALFINAKFSSVFTCITMRNGVSEFKSYLIDECFENLLTVYLKEEVEGRYERFKVIGSYNLGADSYGPPLSPNLLNILIYDIQEEIAIYKTYYQAEFSKYINFVQLSVETFYKLLMVDVQEMCGHIPSPQQQIDLRILALAYRLAMLDRDMEKYLSTEMQTWREPILKLSLVWLDIVECHVTHLVPMLLQKETWKGVEVLIDNNLSKPAVRKMVISSKKQLLTQSCNSAFRRVRSDSEPLAQKSNIMSASNPRLNTKDVIQSAEKIDFNPRSSSSISSDKDNEGIHESKKILRKPRGESSISADGGLTRSVPIEDVYLQMSDSQSGQDIRDIDMSTENEVEKIIKTQTGKSSEPGNVTGLTGKEGLSEFHCTPGESASKRFEQTNQDTEITDFQNSTNTMSPENVQQSYLKRHGLHLIVDQGTASTSDASSQTHFKEPIPSSTMQECRYCPNKDVIDIEETYNSKNIEYLTNDIRHSDEVWNKPGPSGLQSNNTIEPDVVSTQSEYGSVPSHATITSYESAVYCASEKTRTSYQESMFTSSLDNSCKYDSTQREKPLRTDNHEPRIELLPLSSSCVDFLCSLNRLTDFVCHLCSLLCPKKVVTGSSDNDMLIKNETVRVKTLLCTKLIQICNRLVALYVDCLMAVETCGMTDTTLITVLGLEPARDLIERCCRDEVSGCRFNPKKHTRCNSTDPSGKKIKQCDTLNKIRSSTTGCETVTSKMGIRNSDVNIISTLLPWLHNRITLTIRLHKETSLRSFTNQVGCRQCCSESYCHNGPSADDITEGNAPQLSFSQSNGGYLEESCDCLEVASDMQCKLLAYRLNILLGKILHQLLNLSLPTFDIKKRLQPIDDFLHKRLTSLRKVLFPDVFLKMIKYLWEYVVQDFADEVETLKERGSKATEQSVLLLNSIAHLMQFFHCCGKGIHYNELIKTTEVIIKHIELYTTPSPRLIRLYGWLHDQMLTVRSNQLRNNDDITSSVSGSSHQSRAHAPADHLIQRMRIELHATSKCFSGAELVAWVQEFVKNNGYDSLGVCIGISDVETGVELGQYLLERNFLTCVTCADIADNELIVDLNQQSKRRTKGSVFVRDDKPYALSSQMRFNDISIIRTNNSSRPNSSKSSSRPGTDTSELVSTSSYSSSIDSEDITKDLLDSVDIILRQAYSNQSVVQFQNSSDVLYSFLNDEDGAGGEYKRKLDLNDRFSIRMKLNNIVCVLFTRKRKDSEAKQFLKKLPKNFVAQALGHKQTPWCFSI